MPEFLTALVELLAAVLLALAVCVLAGALAVVLAWLYGAQGAALPWWFAAGFGAALLAIGALFAWELREFRGLGR